MCYVVAVFTPLNNESNKSKCCPALPCPEHGCRPAPIRSHCTYVQTRCHFGNKRKNGTLKRFFPLLPSISLRLGLHNAVRARPRWEVGYLNPRYKLTDKWAWVVCSSLHVASLSYCLVVYEGCCSTHATTVKVTVKVT